jgi:hypothetical protein
MAHAAAKLGVRELGAVAKVSPNTITRAEADGALNPSTIAAIQRALEAAGVEFLAGNGVRLSVQVAAKPPAPPEGGSTRKPATGKTAPRPKKPAASDRQATAAPYRHPV